MIGEMQKSLFEKELFSDSKLIRNLAVAFGVTKTGLLNGRYGTLENIFYGMRNLEIPLEMCGVQNAAEILSKFFSAGHLKRRNPKNLHLNPNIPHDFLELVNFLDEYSYNNGFAGLVDNFKKCFDIEQEIRFGILNQKIKNGFVKSFLADYKSPFDDFDDPNRYGEDKGIYAKIIYDEFESLSKRSKQI